ncbi:hypothetical protein RSOLAG1IB_02026 [Rhizoctonia solani AG-1 IB]|uniref:Uncharacterized protein n=1 Tax=Thanatephorus cucumeris (strain AG1-IB / isolate 7/3/14) TaxID=1108050 RepID=A0A0B7FIN9_THACB|nr:hypothetical protein RSOLAG1IB_02026 [Rhizoctonia solani AG-1 IB]
MEPVGGNLGRRALNDHGQVAATIAQASTALAAAAEALAEAASAMSAASRNLGGDIITGASARSVAGSHSINADRGKSIKESQIGSQDTTDRAGCHDDTPDQPAETRLSPPAGAISEISSRNEASAKHIASPALPDNSALPLSPGYEAKIDYNRPAPPSIRPRGPIVFAENNNLKPVPNGLINDLVLTRTHEPLQHGAMGSEDILLAFPKIEAGRNCINLKRVSDSLAFIAYMALQSQRTVCVLTKYSLVNAYAKVLRSLTNGTVICPSGVADLTTTYKDYIGFMKSTPPSLIILPPECLQIVSLRNACPDCFLHWGEPLSPSLYVGQVIDPSPPGLKSCLLVAGEKIDNSTFGVVPYSEATLSIIFGSNTRLSQLRARVLALLPTVGLPVTQ